MAVNRLVFFRAASLGVVVWLLLLMSGCVVTPPVLKIGLVAPFEGADRAIGYDAIYAARLAVREINEAGGIGGYRVALVALDDGGQVDLAAGVAESLVLDRQIVAVVGHGRVATTAVARPIYEEANLIFIPLGEGVYRPVAPELLSAEFRQDYAAVTPFDEVADRYAGPTYEAFQQLFEAMSALGAESKEIGRDTLAERLHLER